MVKTGTFSRLVEIFPPIIEVVDTKNAREDSNTTKFTPK
jgi:hypothetical protein